MSSERPRATPRPSPAPAPNPAPAPAPEPSAADPPPPSGPAPTFSSRDTSSRAPSTVGSISVPTLISICIASALGAIVLVTILLVWLRRRHRVRNARFEGDETPVLPPSLSILNSGQTDSAPGKPASTLAYSSETTLANGDLPHAAAQHTQQRALSMAESGTGVIASRWHHHQAAAVAASPDQPNGTNIARASRRNTFVEHRTSQAVSTASRSKSITAHNFHATRARHSMHDSTFDPARLLEAIGRTSASRRNTIMFGEQPTPDTAYTSESSSEETTRPTSMPLAATSLTRRLEGLLHEQQQDESTDAHSDEPLLEEDDIARRQPTLPDLGLLLSERSSSATSPLQSTTSLARYQYSSPHTTPVGSITPRTSHFRNSLQPPTTPAAASRLSMSYFTQHSNSSSEQNAAAAARQSRATTSDVSGSGPNQSTSAVSSSSTAPSYVASSGSSSSAIAATDAKDSVTDATLLHQHSDSTDITRIDITSESTDSPVNGQHPLPASEAAAKFPAFSAMLDQHIAHVSHSS